MYENEKKNDWHHVTISMSDDRQHLIWENKAGVNWGLYPTSMPLVYTVGRECPYYQIGTTTMKALA